MKKLTISRTTKKVWAKDTENIMAGKAKSVTEKSFERVCRMLLLLGLTVLSQLAAVYSQMPTPTPLQYPQVPNDGHDSCAYFGYTPCPMIAKDDYYFYKSGTGAKLFWARSNDQNSGEIYLLSQTGTYGNMNESSSYSGYSTSQREVIAYGNQTPNAYGVDTGTYYTKLYLIERDKTFVSNIANITIFSIPGDGAENAGDCCQMGLPGQSVGEPVNPTNGNMWLEQTDYSLPRAGEPINVSRFYNSIIQTNGLFGKGWSTQFDESLTAYGDRMVRINMPDGRAVYLGRKDTNSSFNISPQKFFGEAVKNSDGTYTLNYKDGRIHQFASSGKLLWQKDRNGNQTTLNYDTNGNLTGVADTFGRTLNFVVTGGAVSQISDSSGTIADYVYNTDGTLQSVTYPDNSKYKFEYTTINGNTYLTTVKNALDNVLEAHQYDTDGRAITSEKDGGIEKYTFDYTGNTQYYYNPYTTVTDALGRATTYNFRQNERGQKLVFSIQGNCHCGSDSQSMQYEYDENMNVTKRTDALNHITTYTYDDKGNPLTMTDVLGTETYTYNSFGEILTKTDRMNGVWTNTYDANGNLLMMTDPLNHMTALTYNTHGQPLTMTDARNKVITLSYDTSGRIAQVTDANNKNTGYAYDARSRITSITDVLNQTTGFEYDLNNRLKKVIYPDTNFVTYAYDTAGRRTGMTDEKANTTTYGYDNAYRLTSVTDALNHATNFGFDLMSNLVSQIDALGNVTNYEYDDYDRLKKIIYPAATVGATRLEENLTYDAVGNVKTQTDTAGRVANYNYDNANRLIETIDALNKATQFTYNARSQMTKVKDALNQEYDFTYDALGRQLTQTRAGSTMSYEYDAVGNRTKRTDYKAQETDYAFDNLNRLTTITYQMPTPETASYAYDDISRLTSATNPAGTVSFTYDNRNRLAQATDVHGKVLNYSYDAAGNRAELKIGGTNHSTYAYDVVNRLTQLTDEASQNFTFGYDIANRLISKTLPNGITTSYNYDGMNRLTELKDQTTSNVLFDRQYAYNTASQINQISEPSLTRNFAYDLVDRLTQVTNPTNTSESYAYDDVGNRTSSHLSASYTHQATNRLTADANKTYVYDANGSMTSKTDGTNSWSYNWDFENRLASVSNGTSSVSYEYDALGRRVKRVEGTNVTKFTYDGMDVVLDDDTTAGITKYQNGLGIDSKLELSNGSTSKYFLQDHLGSTNALTDQTGSVIASATYDSFGNSTNTLGTRYQFTGREKDDFSGLTYYRARWYDSNLGRFISEDPASFGGGDVNLYGYVWNSPMKFSDPTGLDGWGNDTADWLDERIEYARQYYNPKEEGNPDWWTIGVNNAIANVASGFSDLLRVGSGTGHALYDCDENAYGRAAFVAMDIGRASAIFSMLAGPGARFAKSPTGISLNEKLYQLSGNEIKFSKDFRVAPLGNRTGHPIGEYPHYHRRGTLPNGTTKPGQGIGRHRPWETKSTDTSFWERF